MAMKSVKQDEFESFIRSIPSDGFSSGRDVGRTHGVVCYYDYGKLVATERWILNAGSRQFTYEILEAVK